MAVKEGRHVEISIYGGAAMILAFEGARTSTYDIDAVIKDADLSIRAMIVNIAQEFKWPITWFNDAVKIFTSKNEELNVVERWPDKETGLVVSMAAPEYLLAMKAMSMRMGDDEHDIDDIRFLAKECGLRTADQVFDMVKRFYPENKIPSKTYIGLKEIFRRSVNILEPPAATDLEACARFIFERGIDPRDKAGEIEKRWGAEAKRLIKVHLSSIAINPGLYGYDDSMVAAWGEKFALGRVRMLPGENGLKTVTSYDDF
jgi:hypothetical protein